MVYKHIRATLGMASVLLFSAQVSAQSIDCSKQEEDYSLAQTNLDDSRRLLAVQSLHNDILTLKSLPEHFQGKPRSFWQNCVNGKVKTLNMHIGLASPKLRSNADFHVMISSNFEMRGEYGRAYFHASEASKTLPKDNNLRLKTFALWLRTQDVLLDLEGESSRKGKQLGLGNKSDFDRQMEHFLYPIIKSTTANANDTASAYRVRAAYYESLARVVDAASDWERLAELEPHNVVHLKKLAAFELSRGRKTQARNLLERVILKAPSDLGAQKKLIELYVDKREMQKAQRLLGQALSFYPEDRDLMAFRKMFK